jgi:hypothetical protein
MPPKTLPPKTLPPRALLAIRSDIARPVEAEYLAWLTKEHTIERVGIDGFVSARIFRSRHAAFGRYLILYELADETVVDSPAYLERLNNPTPWSARMMPHLGNFIRGGGRIVENWGAGYGAALIPVLIRGESSRVASQDLGALSEMSGVVATRILQADSERTAVTSNERTLRSGDQGFHTLALIEAIDTEAALRALQRLEPGFREIVCQEAGPRESPAYSLVFHLNG